MKEEKLYESRLNSQVKFGEKYWAVSLVNTGSILGGHSAIIVEGIERVGPSLMDTRLFYGFYDIRARPWPEEETKGSLDINRTGYIYQVTVKEDHDYPPNTDEKFKSYYACTKPIIHEPEKKTSAIRLINQEPSRRDKEKVIACEEILLINKRNHYELGFYDQKEDKYMQRVIEGDYSSLKELKYEDKIEDAKMQENILKLSSSLGGSTEQKSVRKMIKSIKEDQRKIREIDGELDPGGNPNKKLYPAWEFIGMDSVFGPNKRGMNCSNWCADKLYIAGIGDGTRKKPGCIIL